MNRGHCPGNQRKDTRDVQLTHDVTSGARPRQVIRRTHGEQEYGGKCHDAEARCTEPTLAALADRVETQDGKNECSHEMSEAVHRLAEARNCKDDQYRPLPTSCCRRARFFRVAVFPE